MELAVIEWPERAEVRPGLGPNQAIVRFPNDYGASIIPDPHRVGSVELAVAYFPDDEWGGWEYVRGTSVNPYDSVVPGIDSPEALVAYLREIASWEARPWEYVGRYADAEADSVEGRQEWMVVFTWDVGTPYIHAFWPHVDSSDTANAFEVINVWSYAEGKCEVTTREQFRAACDGFLSGTGGDELANYYQHTA